METRILRLHTIDILGVARGLRLFYGANCVLAVGRVSFARQPVRAEGFGSDVGYGALFRRPSGLRAERDETNSAGVFGLDKENVTLKVKRLQK